MKKTLLATFVCLCVSVSLFGQQSGMSFCGVSFSETPTSFIEKLEQKGFIKASAIALKGTFFSVPDCRIFVNPYCEKDASFVARIEVNFPNEGVKNLRRYINVVDMYTAKYGKGEFQLWYDSGLKNRVETTTWYFDVGKIQIKTEEEGFEQSISITYWDYSNTKKVYAEEIKDI